jgi:putative MATE family efflux protein
VYLFLNRITASFGTEAVAALGIGNRVETVSYLICFGFSMAVSALVGQNLGALKPERAEKSVWYTIGISGALTTVIALAFVLFPRQIAGIFIDDPAVVKIAVDYLLIVAVSQPAMAVVIVLEGAFSGAGNTLPPMIASLGYSTARLPIAYLLCFEFGIGVNGVWWAINVTMLVAAFMLYFWFRRGRWKLQEIH